MPRHGLDPDAVRASPIASVSGDAVGRPKLFAESRRARIHQFTELARTSTGVPAAAALADPATATRCITVTREPSFELPPPPIVAEHRPHRGTTEASRRPSRRGPQGAHGATSSPRSRRDGQDRRALAARPRLGRRRAQAYGRPHGHQNSTACDGPLHQGDRHPLAGASRKALIDTPATRYRTSSPAPGLPWQRDQRHDAHREDVGRSTFPAIEYEDGNRLEGGVRRRSQKGSGPARPSDRPRRPR